LAGQLSVQKKLRHQLGRAKTPLRSVFIRRLFFDDLIEKCLLGPVTLVATSIPVPAGRPGRHVGHDPRPCDTVFLYSLSCGCEILKNSACDARQCQQVPASTGYSHSIVDGLFLRFNIYGLVIGVGGNTMKNTKFRNCC